MKSEQFAYYNSTAVKNHKVIPHYINDPVINRLTAPENKLYRPTMNYLRTVLIVSFFLFINLIITYGVAVIRLHGFEIKLINCIEIYPLVALTLSAMCSRLIIIWFIKLYQRYAKSETRLRCCFTPSCSEYAILALKKYGMIYGCIKSIRRLQRCGPPGGIDYP
jgi:putative membrane protein insertion efficiency factor